MSQLIIRKAEKKDVPAIEAIEKQCFSRPWSYESIYADVVENRLAFYLVAEEDKSVIGYAGIWRIFEEGHITNVAVAPEHRRKKVGEALLSVLIDVTERDGVERHTLEVRRSNAAAISLYEKFGFEAAGVRKGYYDDNGEDAVIMWREAAGGRPGSAGSETASEDVGEAREGAARRDCGE